MRESGLSCWILVLLSLLLSACSSLPSELKYEPETALVSYESVRKNPSVYADQPVRWSGLIAETRVQEQGSEIEIVYLPLQANGLPWQREASPGRFIARLTGLLDPALYAKGRSITVLGVVTGMEAGHIGLQAYDFPLVRVSQHKLWPEIKEVEVRYVHDPFCDEFGLMPRGRLGMAP